MEQRRFILAVILSALVMMAWQVFFGPQPPVIVEEPAQEVTEEEIASAGEGAAPGEGESAGAADAEGAGLEQAEAPPVVEVDPRRDRIVTPELELELDNRGAVVRDIKITEPEQYSGEGGELLRAFEEDAPAYPFELVFLDQVVEVAPDALYEVVEEESIPGAETGAFNKLTYRYTDPGGRFVIDKVYTVDTERPYVVHLGVTVKNLMADMRLVDTPALDIIDRDDPEQKSSFLDFRPDVLGAICQTEDGTERRFLEKIEGTIRHSQFGVLWSGADTRYFLMAAIAENGADACVFERADGDYLRSRLVYEGFSIAPGSSWTAGHLLYMGPKDFDVLRDTGHRLEEAIDYGFFTILARPLRRILVWFYGITNNWGLAIILLTLLIKGVTWRITGKAYENAERMKLIQPKIKEIREKYEKDQQRMTEETMKVFKENKVSPLGCLPLLIQMPILYGLFVMIYNSIELYQAEFLWYADLSAPDPWFILPLVMGTVMFFQQRLTMTADTAANPQMAMMMKIMPVMFTAFMLFLPAGLVLYYLLNLIIGLGQQFLVKRKYKDLDASALA